VQTIGRFGLVTVFAEIRKNTANPKMPLLQALAIVPKF